MHAPTRLPHRLAVPVLLALFGAHGVPGCATAPAPAPAASAPAAPATATPTSPAAPAPDHAGAPPPEGPSPATTAPEPVVGPAVPPPGERHAWVNPARCHATCTYDPGQSLLRVDDRAEPMAKGRHRVAAAAQGPLRDLVLAARAAGHVIKVNSAYRSYREQARVYKTTAQPGRAARPGHSEHQLGTAIDLRLPSTAAIDWLAENAAGFGFVRSYPDGKQRLTGYRPEPWHVRFVGAALAAEISRAGVTIEEFLRRNPSFGESGSCGDCPLPASRAPCGDVPTKGDCRGDVLVWCYEGALATVDCTASEQRCGLSPSTGEHDCL